MSSIRARLLVLLLSTFVVVWGGMIIYTWLSTEHEIEEVFDAQLAQASDVLFSITLSEGGIDNSTNSNLVELLSLEKQVDRVRYDALEKKISGDPLIWKSDQKQISVTVTPIKTYKTDGGEFCREYKQSVSSAGSVNYSEGIACRDKNGNWPDMNGPESKFDFLDSDPVHEYENKVSYQVWKDDKLILRSSNAPPLLPMTGTIGYSDGQIYGERWRLLNRKDEFSGLTVIVGEEYAVRQELIAIITLQQFWPVIIVIPVLGILILLSVSRGMRPLRELTKEISKRGVNQLNPVSMEQVPTEVTPIVSSLNKLLTKLSYARDAERKFTSDASHELRTPLAALKAQAQVAHRADKDEVRGHALDKIIEGVDRSSDLVEQLLTLTRLEPESLEKEYKKLDICKIVEESTAQMAHLALEREIDISLNLSKKLYVDGIDTLLGLVVSNLVKNALMYTPNGGKVVVSVTEIEGDVCIDVSDSGIGIPKMMRDRVFDRFYRVPGSEQVGSGLGLSIVKRVTEIHDGDIIIGEADIGGASITVKLSKS